MIKEVLMICKGGTNVKLISQGYMDYDLIELELALNSFEFTQENVEITIISNEL
jgi:hypothetical protein